MLLYADNLLYRPTRTVHDYIRLQQDINSLDNWIQHKYLQFNVTKCKYMIVTRKRNPVAPLTPLSVNNLAVDKVNCFKYLGVWLSHNLTWNKHIEEICKSSTKQIGMIYRKFYQYSSQETLLHLYVTLIRTRLEYAAPVWDPSHHNLIHAVEKVQKFAIRMCFKSWSIYSLSS